ncbi:hypothetical protein B738_09451 [Photorhabdus temperata subsp. temperata M1021]|nr:hypothetical protein B738_09451 [Photorhabdus temperata subsp. temperata M1021]
MFLVFFIIIMLGPIQLFIVKYGGYHEIISMFINLNSEVIRVGSVIFFYFICLHVTKKILKLVLD